MSTDGSGDAPLTRAQLRALRAAAEQTQAEPALTSAAEQPPTSAAEQAPTPEQAPEPEQAPDQAPEPGPAHTPDPQAQETPAPAAVPPVPAPTAPVAVGVPVVVADASSPPQPTPRSVEPESAPGTAGRRPDRRFAVTLLGVLAVLAVLTAVLGVISLTQGPRLSQVQVDPAQAIDTSGSRLILTANQSLQDVAPTQVTIDPEVPFTVDTAGRGIGIRFTVPLDDDTPYRITVRDVVASGGGPTSVLTTTFRTPAARILLLQRNADGDDTIFVSELEGEKATPVFRHPRINDFRATADLIVVAVEEDEQSRLIAMRRDGSDQRELDLPGTGYVSSVQVSDRGGLVGYTYSDRELTETSGRASVLVTQPLSGAGEPRIAQLSGEDANVAEWQFVPDTSSLLFIDFDGALSVAEPTTSADVQSLGTAAAILGVSRGTYTAIVERTDASIVQLDLTTGEETALPASEPDYGDADAIVPFPGGTLRHVVQRDEAGLPTGQAIVRVDEDGAATVISEVSGTDSIVQTCVSPSGRYAAVVTAPDLPNNPYDDLLLPLPTTLHTRLIDLQDDSELPTLSGFDISWCTQAPRP